MQIKWMLLGLAWASLPLLLVVHGLLVRVLKGKSGQNVVLLAILAGNLPFLALSVWCLWPMRPQLLLPLLAYLLVVYQGFGYAYFHFYNMSETARRIRLLILIYQGRLKRSEEAASAYSPEEMVRNRLGRLTAMGQLTQNEVGRYVAKGGILLFAAKMIAAYRQLLGLDDWCKS
ncbi:MAG: hypothetical protein RRB13_14730 [bacterium]|nr:hypothetical protein [bacterium]